MLMLYLIGTTTKDFEGGATQKTSVKVRRNIGRVDDYFDVVAFKEVAEECRKIKGGSKVAIEGTLQKSKFGDTWYYTIVINDIKVIEKSQKPKQEEMNELLDNLVEIQERPAPIEEITTDDEDLPF